MKKMTTTNLTLEILKRRNIFLENTKGKNEFIFELYIGPCVSFFANKILYKTLLISFENVVQHFHT